MRAANSYTYTPFGSVYEGQCIETVANPWKFTGQWHDAEIDQYHLRARQYDPAMMRFTSRDPVRGKYHEPLTLHRYLYCGNDGINKIDLDGRWAIMVSGSVSGTASSRVLGNASKSDMASLIQGGLGIHSLMRQALIGLVALEASVGFGGTAGAGIVAGQDANGRAFFGAIYYGAAGGVVCNGGGASGSATLDIGFSPNAQSMQHLAGGFTEFGGSVTVPGIVGSIFTGFTLGATYSLGDTGAEMYTISLGAGTLMPGTRSGVSWEGHSYRGYAWVHEW